MELRPLGSTGLTVSPVCAGGSGLGSMPAIFGYDVSAEQAIEVVLRIFDSPISWIDTSNGYSDGESERRIGAAIREYGGLPDGFLVATKVDARGADYSGARVRASVAESKERLGLDDLPLVYLHDPEFHDFDTMREAVDTLMQLRADGGDRACRSGRWQPDRARAISGPRRLRGAAGAQPLEPRRSLRRRVDSESALR